LEKPNNMAQAYFNRADAFMVAINSDEVVADINQKACEILGFKKEEVKGKNWFDNFLPKQGREDIRRLFHNMLTGINSHMHYEHAVITKQGKARIFDFHNITVTDEKGSIIGILSSGTDITQKRKKEKTLKQMEDRLHATIDYMIEGCQIIDHDWRYVYVNEAVAKQGRKTKEELLGRTMMQAYPGIDKTPMFNHLRNCMINRVSKHIDNEFTFPDGSTGWFELRIEPVPEGILILSIDITESRKIEAELNKYRNRLEEVVAERTAECAKANRQLTAEIQQHKKTEEGLKLRALILDNAINAIFLVNTKGEFAYANEAASKDYGYNLDEFLNMNIAGLLQPRDASSMKSLLEHVVEKGQTSLEMVHLRKDRTQMPVKLYSNVVKTMHGQFVIFVVQKLYFR
jgi:PAS domain S-box-containing protein